MKHLFTSLILIIVSNSFGNGYKWKRSGDSWYHIPSGKATYKEAAEICISLKGYLTSVVGYSRDSPLFKGMTDGIEYLLGMQFDINSNCYRDHESCDPVGSESHMYIKKAKGKGNCLIFVKSNNYLQPKKVDCTNKFRFICRSINNKKCVDIVVGGFKFQPQFNGIYRANFSPKKPNGDLHGSCDYTKPIYVKIATNQEMICSHKAYDKFAFLKLGSNDCKADEAHEFNATGQWVDADVNITCLPYSVPATSPSTIVSATTATTSTIRLNDGATITAREPASQPAAESEDQDAFSNKVLTYMNKVIWTLVAVFVIVDVGLFLWYRKLLRRKTE